MSLLAAIALLGILAFGYMWIREFTTRQKDQLDRRARIRRKLLFEDDDEE